LNTMDDKLGEIYNALEQLTLKRILAGHKMNRLGLNHLVIILDVI
jgi:hypothetical protein